ncbi:MAG: glycosyltransferase [Pseudobutyrivibrio sp.]|nr:glycosyltransferase [Pseudobutyrivibrio sp.]
MEKLSIIVPVFNKENYLKKTINSILSQTYTDIELILIDDGSTDKSRNICDDFSLLDNRIKVYHQKNRGSRITRIVGVQKATSKYVAFVDADDWIEADTFEKLMKAVAEHHADITTGAYVIDTEDGIKDKFNYSKELMLDSHAGLIELFSGEKFNWSMCNKVYKKSLFSKIDITELSDESYGEDTYFNYIVFRKSKNIFYTPNFGYHYVYRKNSLMNSSFCKRRFVYIKQWKDIIEDCGKRGEEETANVVIQLLLTEGMSIVDKAYEIYGRDDSDVRYFMNLIYDFASITPGQERLCKQISWKKRTTVELKELYLNRDLELKEALMGNSKIYIYGAGKIANEVASFLEDKGLDYSPIVSKSEGNIFRNKLVKNYRDVDINQNDILILALSEKNKEEVEKTINPIGRVLDFGKYSSLY